MNTMHTLMRGEGSIHPPVPTVSPDSALRGALTPSNAVNIPPAKPTALANPASKPDRQK